MKKIKLPPMKFASREQILAILDEIIKVCDESPEMMEMDFGIETVRDNFLGISTELGTVRDYVARQEN